MSGFGADSDLDAGRRRPVTVGHLQAAVVRQTVLEGLVAARAHLHLQAMALHVDAPRGVGLEAGAGLGDDGRDAHVAVVVVVGAQVQAQPVAGHLELRAAGGRIQRSFAFHRLHYGADVPIAVPPLIVVSPVARRHLDGGAPRAPHRLAVAVPAHPVAEP